VNNNNDLSRIIEKSRYLRDAALPADAGAIVSVADFVDHINRAAYRRRLEGITYSEPACSSMPRH